MAHYELYLLGLLGIVIHYLKDFEVHRKQGKKYSLPALLPTIILSIITTGTLIYLKDAIAELYVITPFAAVILGYFGNSVFFSFINAKNPLSSKLDGGVCTSIYDSSTGLWITAWNSQTNTATWGSEENALCLSEDLISSIISILNQGGGNNFIGARPRKPQS